MDQKYQFHQVVDVKGSSHVVKDSEIVQIVWRKQNTVGDFVLVNGSKITVKGDGSGGVPTEYTFPAFPVSHNVDSENNHILNRDHIDDVESVGGDKTGTIGLSNGDKIEVEMGALIQVIEVLKETLCPQPNENPQAQ